MRGARTEEPFTIWRPYIAGVLHGDAWCTELTLGLRVKDRDFAEIFAEGLRDLFDLALYPRLDERGYWLLRAGNKSARFSHLKEYEPRDNDEVSSWVRGLFDSEGNANLCRLHRGESSYSRRIALFSTRLATLFRASDYLNWLGVPHIIRPTKNSATHKGTKTVWELRVVRREGFVRFQQMVGSSIQRKQRTIDEIVGTYQPDGWQARNWQRAVLARYPHLAEDL